MAHAQASEPDRQPRPGRRPGNSGSRERILAVARDLFARNGFDKTTIRSIAAGAEVDSALVHHYFGTKHALFVAAIDLPVDPRQILARLHDGPLDEIGRRLAAALIGVWDSPHRAGIIAVFRTAIAGGDVGLIRTFLLDIVLKELVPVVDRPTGTGPLRVELAATQMAGVMLMRHILELEPLASFPSARLTELVAPTLQRYLTGDLPARTPAT